MDISWTAALFAIIFFNVGVGLKSKGWVLPATIGIISISIAVDTLFTATYADIAFAPYPQLLLLVVAIYGLWGAYHGKSNG